MIGSSSRTLALPDASRRAMLRALAWTGLGLAGFGLLFLGPRRWTFEGLAAVLWVAGLVELRQIARRETLCLRRLKKTEDRARLISDNVGDVVWLADLATHRFTFVSPSVLPVTGFAVAEVLDRPFEAFLTPESARETLARLEERRQALLAGDASRRTEVHTLEHVKRDGSIMPMEVRSTLIQDASGAFTSILGVSHDVTEKKAAHDALRASEELFSRAFALSPDSININRLEDGAYIAINEGFTKITGYAAGDILGRSSLDPDIQLWVDPRDRQTLVQCLKERGECTGLEALFRTRDGRQITGLMSARVIDINGEPCILSISRDISDRKRAEVQRQEIEAQLAHAQKMESLGTLASGVAHDMNNVLMAIMGIAETLPLTHPGDGPLASAAEVILRAGGRGRDLVRGLTQFARNEIQEAQPIDITRLVREEMLLLRRTLLQKVDLVEDLEDPLPAVLGESGTLGSVIMNLCVNAVDAMPDGGRLTLRTRSLPDGMVELSVEDTGTGMTPEVLAKAMEPFYTTKAPGKGTGLGLSMAYTTARAHGGTLEIHSEPGWGTTVVLRLPGMEAASGAAPQRPGPAESRPLRILLVDDEEIIRISVPALLSHLGHRVETAAGGQEALDRLEAGPAPDLVILDLNMPVLDGAESLRRIRALGLTLPVLVSTGYLDEDTERLLAQDPRAQCIRKPFTLDEIEGALQRLVP